MKVKRPAFASQNNLSAGVRAGVQAPVGSHLFRKPYWSPPGNLGLQFFAWGEGGPNGSFVSKANTVRPSPGMVTNFLGVSVPIGPSQFLFGMVPAPPQGQPHARPINPFINFVSSPADFTKTAGLSKS